jgi:hypothetical protein
VFSVLTEPLSDALVSFLEERPFEAISVREICGRAMAQFFAGAVLAVIAWWLENEMPFLAEVLTRYLDQLLSKENESSDVLKG